MSEERDLKDMSLFGATLMSLIEDEHLGVSEHVEIAKGKYEAIADMKQAARKLRRAKYMRRAYNIN